MTGHCNGKKSNYLAKEALAHTFPVSNFI